MSGIERQVERQVYVISDLHLGGDYSTSGKPGDRGFRLCTHVPELAEFTRELATRDPATSRVELVINGDLVDFLAEGDSGWVPFIADPEQAVRRFDAIVERDRIFFEALAELLERGHRLTMLLGNHDIELCLPQVRSRLDAALNLSGRHDFNFVHDGEAYSIGSALIEHGNRYDSFNFVDYEALSRIRTLLSRGFSRPDLRGFEPPVGSKLVCSVFNEIKQRYGFIDLLKPESLAVAPLLLALEPGLRKKLATIAKLGLQQAAQNTVSKLLPVQVARRGDAIGEDISSVNTGDVDGSFGSDMGATASSSSGGEMGGGGFPIGVGDRQPREPDALVEALKETLGDEASEFLGELDGVDPAASDPSSAFGSDISAGDGLGRAFSLLQLVASKDDGRVERRLPLLARALQALHNDRTFDRDVELATNYVKAAERLGNRGFRYVLFGHTHLAKRIELDGGVTYLNSGTWCDLMEFPKDVLDSDARSGFRRLRDFVKAMGEGRYAPWIRFAPTYVRLDVGAGEEVVEAELCEYGSTPSG